MLTGKSSAGVRALGAILSQIELVAPTEANVLITGESGTGKELIAREIHNRSSRKRRTLIKVNCASIPKELYESEFFGHIKGTFTGAVKDRAGRLEMAEGGTSSTRTHGRSSCFGITFPEGRIIKTKCSVATNHSGKPERLASIRLAGEYQGTAKRAGTGRHNFEGMKTFIKSADPKS